jgi:hypothetical protein
MTRDTSSADEEPKEHAMTSRITPDTERTRALAIRITLWATCIIALAAGVAILAVDGSRTAVDIAHGQAPISLLVSQQIAPSGPIVTSGYDIGLVLMHASAGAVWLAAIAAVLQALTQVLLCALIALLAWRLLRGAPFRPTLSRLTVFGGAALLLGGILTQLFVLLANGVSLAEINELSVPGSWSLAGRFDLTFIGIGAVLILTGVTFRIGERMQRDTEGLV